MKEGHLRELPIIWLGSAKENLQDFPLGARQSVGFALYQAQLGNKHKDAKPLKGFSGASVLEIVARDSSDTYRAVYTVKFQNAIYVLHALQKKSKKGIQTPKQDIDLIRRRLQQAERDNKEAETKQ